MLINVEGMETEQPLRSVQCTEAKGVCVCVLLLPPQKSHMHRVGQNRMCTPYMTVYLVISLPKLLCIHRIYM